MRGVVLIRWVGVLSLPCLSAWAAAASGQTAAPITHEILAPQPPETEDFIQSLQQEALPDLIDSITDKGRKKHLRLLRIEGGSRDSYARNALLRAYAETDSEGVRCKLIESLGAMRDPALFGWLSQRLQDPRVGIQCFAIWALGELRSRQAADALMHKLWSPERYVQMAAIDALGKTGKDSTVAYTLEAFLREDDAQFRFITAKALDGVAGQDAAPTLLSYLQREPSLDVQEALARTIGHIGGTVAVARFTELLKNDPSAATEHWAEIGLESSDAALLIPALAPLLEGDDVSLKITAARILDGVDVSDAADSRILWTQDIERWMHSSDPVAQEAAGRFLERVQAAESANARRTE